VKERRARKSDHSSAVLGTTSPSSSEEASGSGEDEDDDSCPKVQGLEGTIYCPPYGHPKLYATYSTRSSPEPKSVELCFRNGVWEGDGIKMMYECLIFDGVSYDFELSDPLIINIQKDNVRIIVTE